MRILFAGRDNPFNRQLVKYFSKNHEIIGCFFLESERGSWKGKLQTILHRIKKYGILEVIDQMAFHIFDRLFLRKSEPGFWKTRPEYCDTNLKLACPEYRVDNINGKDWIRLCREMEPDVILATCCRVIFKPQLYNIPALGTYIIHEGITPEYKGLHTPLWALMKKEFQYIGYTVLKVNDRIDGGEILLQNTYKIKEGEGYKTWSWIGHNAIISGLENINDVFRELESKRYFVPVRKKHRKNGYYSWMGLSDFIGLYIRNYWHLSNVGNTSKSNRRMEKRIDSKQQNVVAH